MDMIAEREFAATRLIDQLYRAILGRQADPIGIEHYVARRLEGATESEIVASLLDSDEYRTKQLGKARALLADTAASRFPRDYVPPGEFGRSYLRRLRSGFLDLYCGGDVVLDVGFSGYDNPDRKTAIPRAIGVDLDYPGYDGLTLPFADDSVDTVLSSHCLEHILFDHAAIRDWYRVLRIGGFIVCFVPHQALYEKRRFLPSRWNGDHKRMYTPASLLAGFEQALPVNSYRVRHLADNDAGFDYDLGPEVHSNGAYEIELVIEKIMPPAWTLG